MRKVKDAYALWHGCHATLPKTHRHSLGLRIDTIFIEVIEAISAAQFLQRHEKLPFVRFAIKKTDTLKVLLLILWECKSLDNRRYLELSARIEEFGKMLGGWNGQLVKKKLPRQSEREMKRLAGRRTRTRCRGSTCRQACRSSRPASGRRRCGSRRVGSDRRRKRAERRQCHHPSSTLGAVSNPASQCPSAPYQASSIFWDTCTTLPEAMAVDTPDARMPGSVAGSRDRPQYSPTADMSIPSVVIKDPPHDGKRVKGQRAEGPSARTRDPSDKGQLAGRRTRTRRRGPTCRQARRSPRPASGRRRSGTRRVGAERRPCPLWPRAW